MITITPAGISVEPALVAGEPVAVSVSGFTLAEGAALTLVASACKANYPIATAVLEAGDEGAWTGTLDTATSAASMLFAGASACETRDIRLELLDTAHRDSLAALCCPLQNSTLIPALNPQAVPPAYLAVPGPPGSAATVEIGETTTFPAGSSATVRNTGSATAAVLEFGIPQGLPGNPGADGRDGDALTLDGVVHASDSYNLDFTGGGYYRIEYTSSSPRLALALASGDTTPVDEARPFVVVVRRSSAGSYTLTVALPDNTGISIDSSTSVAIEGYVCNAYSGGKSVFVRRISSTSADLGTTAEPWTFTLSDNSTVAKTVCTVEQ